MAVFKKLVEAAILFCVVAGVHVRGMEMRALEEDLDPIFVRELEVGANEKFVDPPLVLEPRDDRMVLIGGDAVLGAILQIHERPSSSSSASSDSRAGSPRVCGPLVSVQTVEALLYTLDRVNDAGFLPGVKLGAKILNDCGDPQISLRKSLEFLQDTGDSVENNQRFCSDGSFPSPAPTQNIAGVVGPASSEAAAKTASLLGLFGIPSISHGATGGILSDAERFPNFHRTVSSDTSQAVAMASIAKLFGWEYVSIVYEDSDSSKMLHDDLVENLSKEGICVSTSVKVDGEEGSGMNENQKEDVVRSLIQSPKARGVLLLTNTKTAEMLEAVARDERIPKGHFVWLGPDAWCRHRLRSDAAESGLEGAICLSRNQASVPGFSDYFRSLTVENNMRNPWFREYWEQYFGCAFYAGGQDVPQCTGTESYNTDEPVIEDDLGNVARAVLAFAVALRDMQEDLCPSLGQYGGLCNRIKPIDGNLLNEYVNNVTFSEPGGEIFRFSENGDAPSSFDVLQFQQKDCGRGDPDCHQWATVGSYKQGIADVHSETLMFPGETSARTHQPAAAESSRHVQAAVGEFIGVPGSVCSEPCQDGQQKLIQNDKPCCWLCLTQNDEIEKMDSEVAEVQKSPEKFRLVSIARDGRTATFSWQAPTRLRDIQGLEIESWSAGQGVKDIQKTVIPSETFPPRYTISSLTPGTVNYVRARYLLEDGTRSSPSDAVKVTTAESTSGPVPFLNAIPIGNSRIHVFWDKPSDPNGAIIRYNLRYRQETPRGIALTDWTEMEIEPNTHEVMLEGLRPNRQHRIEIDAETRGGRGVSSFVLTSTHINQGATASDGTLCPSGWLGNGAQCYQYFDPRGEGLGVNWQEARDRCRAEGASLASVHSDRQARFLWNDVMENEGYAWLGLYLGSSEWMWSDSSPVDFLNWSGTMVDKDWVENLAPSAGGNAYWSACGFMDQDSQGSWRDNPCELPFAHDWSHRPPLGFICQRRGVELESVVGVQDVVVRPSAGADGSSSGGSFPRPNQGGGSAGGEQPRPCQGKNGGYAPDPKSCHFYYQCANGISYKMPCPAKLYWSQEKLQCLWKHQSDCPLKNL